jgi:DNA-binding MarR family transcriptional regulator
MDRLDPSLTPPEAMDTACGPMNDRTPRREDLPWDEIGFVAEKMSFASRPLHAAVKDIVEEYDLGPRGAWILLLIHTGEVYPLDVANVFGVGRSLITAELTRLIAAGLITSVQGKADRRRMELTLTEEGERTYLRVKQGLSTLINGRLRNYSREEILLCARILQDMQADGD